jgi:hypothetical protein
MRFAVSIAGFLISLCATAATLEKLTIEQMAQKSTIIIRGKITGCAGEKPGVIIYTRCGVAVSETWKGAPKKNIDFVVPGGRVQAFSQTYAGAPKFNANEQYVLFLWVGRSGVPQIIGLSQGVFDVTFNAKGQATVRREATSDIMLDSTGTQIRDEPVSTSMSDLRQQVDRALAGGIQK